METAPISITITLILIIFTCLISYQAFNDSGMKNKFLFHPASVHEFGQWYRFITSGFLHGSWMHLGVNMYVLWMFGENLEKAFISDGFFGPMYGRIFYLLIYLGAIVVGSLPLYMKHKNNQYYSALGASGGVSGVLFGLIVLAPWSPIRFIFFPFFDIPFVVFGVLYLVYEHWQSKQGQGLIAHDAHIWGAIFGIVAVLVISFIMNPDLISFYIANLLQGPAF